MPKKLKAIFITLFFLFFYAFPPGATAAFSFNISGVDTAIVTTKEQEVLVTLSITDLPSGDSYFRVGWESGNSYVGYMKNNADNWIKLNSLGSVNIQNQDCFNYFKVTSNEATQSVSLKIKVGSENEVANGSANLRAHRFTSTCRSYDFSDPYSMTVNLPTPVPAESPTQQPTASPTPSPSPSPTPTKSPTPIATPKKSTSPTPTLIASIVSNEEPLTPAQGDVLGLGITASPSPLVASENVTRKKFPLAAVLFITGGLAFVGLALFMFFRSYQKEKMENS